MPREPKRVSSKKSPGNSYLRALSLLIQTDGHFLQSHHTYTPTPYRTPRPRAPSPRLGWKEVEQPEERSDQTRVWEVVVVRHAAGRIINIEQTTPGGIRAATRRADPAPLGGRAPGAGWATATSRTSCCPRRSRPWLGSASSLCRLEAPQPRPHRRRRCLELGLGRLWPAGPRRRAGPAAAEEGRGLCWPARRRCVGGRLPQHRHHRRRRRLYLGRGRRRLPRPRRGPVEPAAAEEDRDVGAGAVMRRAKGAQTWLCFSCSRDVHPAPPLAPPRRLRRRRSLAKHAARPPASSCPLSSTPLMLGHGCVDCVCVSRTN